MSEYSKKKRSESLKKVVRTPEWKANISKAHIGLRHSAASREKMRKSHLGEKHSPERRENATAPKRKHWNFLSPMAEAVHIYDLKRFCRENGLHSGNMYQVSSGKRSQHKGWRICRD